MDSNIDSARREEAKKNVINALAEFRHALAELQRNCEQPEAYKQGGQIHLCLDLMLGGLEELTKTVKTEL